jgi:nucleotide-binding universal stress UspA family protein
MPDAAGEPVFRRLLVGYDGSPSSEKALERAARLALLGEARVTVVNVIPAVSFGKPDPFEEMEQRRLVAEVRQKLVERGVEADVVGIVGDPAEELVASAREREADLILVGSRGHGAAGRLLLGSVSTGVVHRADRDVLVVQ